MSDSQRMQRFGEKLRILRHRRQLTLRELAAMLNVHHSHVGRIEQGLKPSIDLTIHIAEIFDVSLDTLMRDNLDLE